MTTIYYGECSLDTQRYYLATTDAGLCFVGSPNQSLTEIDQFIAVDQLVLDQARLTPFVTAIQTYWTGQTTNWSVPIDLIGGTDLQRQVWTVLQTIPYGQTRDYGQIAQQIGRPTAIRAVASAIGRNPLLLLIPCHRVLRKDGALGGYRGGLALKRQLLELEQNPHH